MPTLTTNSASANGATRCWTKFDDFVQEVANARIYDGVRYRNSTEGGTAMGNLIGKLAETKYPLAFLVGRGVILCETPLAERVKIVR